MPAVMSKSVVATPTCSRPAASIPTPASAVRGARLVQGRRCVLRTARDVVIRASAPAATIEIAPPKAGEEELFKAINTIRFLSIDGVNKANSGHPGLPMGCAPMAYLIFNEYLVHNPKNPLFPNRDRFVLSAGHGSMLQYSLLHLTGYESVQVKICFPISCILNVLLLFMNLPVLLLPSLAGISLFCKLWICSRPDQVCVPQLDDLKQFRQWGSKTPGHPENFETLGIEVTTGGALACLFALGLHHGD